ncbi:ABC transporter permease [Actinoplanes sp. M2I2]|uniref:ABC transporter permease n=1 Tax=Actinoplanes sp. M2I2 TaxID=1734444 RepID=UPI00202191C5|nr:ABC transporter permease [Actinoplanes sp. M2I2]
MAEQQPAESVLRFRRFALAVCVIGVLVQLGLTAYYLGMGHKAQPRDVPVGLVSPAADRTEVVSLLTRQGYFKVTDYATADDLEIAIKRRDVYGGVDITGTQPHLYVASAAGPAAANLLRTTFTSVVQQQTAATLAQLAESGSRITVARAQQLNAPPPITDVVPLPDDDVNGVSLGFITQALALGGTVASMGLGRLIPRTRRSWRRGIAHVSTLIVYAVASAAVVIWSMGWFSVGITADRGEMLAIFSLISLAITASTAGAVALFGPPGAVIGALYFTLGTVISGASILPEFLPDFGRILGANLPTGAGVQAVRDNLYFPAAEIHHHLIVLALYAGIGAVVVLVTNMLPNRRNRTSEVELDLAHRLEGAERREPVNLS